MGVTTRATQARCRVKPEGWQVKRLDDIGFTYSGLTGKSKEDFGTGSSKYVPFLNVIDNVAIDIDSLGSVSLSSSECQNAVRKGDLFFNTSSETPEEVGMCSTLLDNVRGVYLNSFCFGFRLYNDAPVDNLFLAYLFRSGVGRQLVYSLAQGATRYNLSQSAFLELEVPLPSLAEQKYISKVLSDVDALIARLDALISKKRDVKTATMRRLLSGEQRLPGFQRAWGTKRLGEISQIQVGRTPERSNSSFWGSGHPWAAISDLDSKVVQNTDEEITDAAAANMPVIPEGTLMMSFKLSLGRVAFTGRDMYSNEAICSFLNPSMSTDFLYYALQEVQFMKYGRQAVKGVTLNKESLHVVAVPCPALEEQNAIAEVLTDMDAEIKALKARRDKTNGIKQGMMQELLTGRTRLIDTIDGIAGHSA